MSSACINAKDRSELILIPEGEFLAGGPEADEGGGEPFTVHLPAFCLGIYPVTNAQYEQYVKETGRRAPEHWGGSSCPPERASHPVVQINWREAKKYCKWAGLRLPSELEWEKGARGTDGRVFPWGNDWDVTKCRNAHNRGGEETCEVKQYALGRSPWGLYQLAGNVEEWCEDRYDADAYARYRDGDLTPPASGGSRVHRGGSWLGEFSGYFRCAARIEQHPFVCLDSIGFRVASTDPPADAA